MYFLEILVPGCLFKISAEGESLLEVGHLIATGQKFKEQIMHIRHSVS